MGRKNRSKQENKNKEKKIETYTKDQRSTKITGMIMELSMLDMNHIITPEIRMAMTDYVESGVTKEIELPLKQYGRTLIMKLYNDKKITSFMNLRYDTSVVTSGLPNDPVLKFQQRLDDLKKQGFQLTR